MALCGAGLRLQLAFPCLPQLLAIGNLTGLIYLCIILPIRSIGCQVGPRASYKNVTAHPAARMS
jgi:hypothetical protein